MRLLAPLLATLVLLAGCASMSEDQCRRADWLERGQRDGRNGENPYRIDDHRKACGKVGIVPDLRLSMPAATEREATTTRALGPWQGPDVRDRDRVRPVAWPSHGGHVGPCVDETVCRALRAIGASPAASR